MTTEMPTTLGGRYQLGPVLGYGGMAEVYLARDIRLGRDVAVKVLRADLARDPNFLARFRREAQSAAGLNHPHIVGVYDTGDENGVPYIVMEYVAGRTLRDVLVEEGRLLPRRALEITAEICSALEYSHRAGIVHRDIKPANVMLTRTGEVKVMDFGIARAAAETASNMTQTSQVLGTAQYLSPEQARGEHVDARSDVYSTGCLLYELLTGVPPFQGDSPVAVAYQHVREDPAPPSSLDRELPATIDAVVLKAMAKNPANRYQSAEEFRVDLDRAASGRRVEATPVLRREPMTAVTTVTAPDASPTSVLLRSDERDRRGRRTAAYIALAVAVVLVFVAAALIARNVFSGGSTSVMVPQTQGMPVDQAEAALQAAKLHPAVTLTPSSTVTKGTVIRSDPLNGYTVKTGSTVTLFVSNGVAMVTIPDDLVGKSKADATAELQKLGLTVGQTTTVNQMGTANSVTQTQPGSGTSVKAGSSVDLTVISGQATVPGVVGEEIDQATAQLTDAGFKVATQSATSDQYAAGIVSFEDPPSATLADLGSTITLTVSTGPPMTSSAPPTTPSDSSSGSPSNSPSDSTGAPSSAATSPAVARVTPPAAAPPGT